MAKKAKINNKSKAKTKSKTNSKKSNKSAEDKSVFVGVLDITRSGVGYVVIEGKEKDVLVRPGDFNGALHGDTVKVKVTSVSQQSQKMMGVVTQVLQRKQSQFIGKVFVSNSQAIFEADTERTMPEIIIPLDQLNGADHLDRVVVTITQWDAGKRPFGKVMNVLDEARENDIAMQEIILENGFHLTFPQEVLEETAAIPDEISASEISIRKDIRDIFTITIDPVDAKDFDDAISIRKLKNGNWEIGVHIADVSYYVRPGTALDTEAYARATSVYLPDRVVPMLPERISNELCSLRPGEDKLAFSIIFQISEEGKVVQHWYGRTVIHSNHRFTYEEVQEIIETGEGLHFEEILLLNQFAQSFRKKRFKKGAINFSSQEVRFKLNDQGKPIGIVVKESKESHQLVEEFMLLANKYIAEAVSKVKVNKHEIPFPYRVHDEPDEAKLSPFIKFAKRLGYDFDTSSPIAIAKSFNEMLAKAEGKPEKLILEQLGIRTMAKAVYTADNIGHYGLGFEYYCHFTSPIRRYPDVLVHRVLEDILMETPTIDKKMEEKCKHSSDRERAAMEAERASNKYKQVEYMRDFIGHEFDGVISGVAAFGFWVETIEHKCEGLVSVADLSDYDDFRHIETDYALVGMRSGRKFKMGDKVRIKVISGNLQKRTLDYEWVKTPEDKLLEGASSESNNGRGSRNGNRREGKSFEKYYKTDASSRRTSSKGNKRGGGEQRARKKRKDD